MRKRQRKKAARARERGIGVDFEAMPLELGKGRPQMVLGLDPLTGNLDGVRINPDGTCTLLGLDPPKPFGQVLREVLAGVPSPKATLLIITAEGALGPNYRDCLARGVAIHDAIDKHVLAAHGVYARTKHEVPLPKLCGLSAEFLLVDELDLNDVIPKKEPKK